MTTDNILAPVAALTLPDAGALTGRAQQALAFVREFVIATPEDYAMAGEELQSIKGRLKSLETQRTGIVGPLNNALRAINALFKQPTEVLEEGERLWKQKMLAFKNEQDRIAAEARREAEEKAAAERKAIEDEANRQAAIAKEAADAALKAAAAGDQQAADLATANAHRAQAAANAAVQEAQLTTAAPVVQIAPVKASGISTATKLDFEVVDLLALVRHIVEKQPELITLIRADDVRLRAYVKSLGAACALPGVMVTTEQVMRARSA